jgi:hypothetical protein
MSMRVDLHSSVKKLVGKYHIDSEDVAEFWVDMLEALEWYDSEDVGEVNYVKCELAEFEQVRS